MQKDDFLIHKESFIKSRRENILQFYDIDPKVPQSFIQELGKGAYGIVYRAKEKFGSGEWRAIKKIAKKNIKQPELLLN